jgi:drug/metabolite transporter (DMT)-like permease
MAYIGEIAALATALTWAISVIFFRQLGGIFTPLNLNLWKGIISIACLGVSLFFMSAAIPETKDLLWLLLSGVIGIGVGDTAFFAALNRMGERSTLLVAETLAPVFTALLAVVWISEVLTVIQWLAIAVILLGIDIVLGARKRKHKELHFSLSGLSFAALAALCQAVGAVIGRDILIHSDIDSVTASLVRLIGGVVLVVPLLSISKQPWMPKQKLSQRTWLVLFGATFLGTFIAMVLQMFSFAHAEAAVVQSLFAFCIIFSLIIAIIQGEKVSRNSVIGSLIATVGIGFIFLS